MLFRSNLKLIFPEKSVWLNYDRARIKLLLKNLVENALNHSVKAEVSHLSENNTPVSIKLEVADELVIVKIIDTGQGIGSGSINNITEPFYRVDPSRQRETGGYGLGLYLCRMIVEAHGGTLKVKSKLGVGTTVSVELPNRR